MDHRSQSLRRWWLGSPLTLRERRDLRERLSGRLEDLVRQGAIRLSDGARHCDGANFCRRRKHVLERFCERRHDLLEGAGEPRADLVSLSRDLARGRRLYAGLSDFPAWRLARTATIAELRGAVPIAGLQVEYSLVERTPEHELLPAGHALGLGVVTFSPLGGGMLTGKYRNGEKGRAEGFGGAGFQPENTPQRTAILDALLAEDRPLLREPLERLLRLEIALPEVRDGRPPCPEGGCNDDVLHARLDGATDRFGALLRADPGAEIGRGDDEEPVEPRIRCRERCRLVEVATPARDACTWSGVRVIATISAAGRRSFTCAITARPS